jgi:hypothetical protein
MAFINILPRVCRHCQITSRNPWYQSVDMREYQPLFHLNQFDNPNSWLENDHHLHRHILLLIGEARRLSGLFQGELVGDERRT